MQLRVYVEGGDDLFVGDLQRLKRPRGLLAIATPELQLPSGMSVRVAVEYDPEADRGAIDVVSGGTALAGAAPITGRYFQLTIRLATEEVLWVICREI